jgi:sphingolipid delta-4 desaturase
VSASFFVSAADQPHPERTRAILKAHPEIRNLVGTNPWTALIMLAVVGLQVALAAALGRFGTGYWWLALILAYCVGAFANHCLYVVIHDATHRLVFRNRFANHIVCVIADLPNVVPGAIGFGLCHLKHHAHQGNFELDADLASDWEASLIGNSWLGKSLWLLFFPLFQIVRPLRTSSFSVVNGWTVVSVCAAIAFDCAIVFVLGWNAFLYLAASLFFSIGLHPLGGRWIQEHFTLDPLQETGSYYGALNIVALNVGYHNEHHDFPSVPWNRLPKVRAAAPEFYDSLASTSSWLKLWLSFLFDSRYSLRSRVLRAPAN